MNWLPLFRLLLAVQGSTIAREGYLLSVQGFGRAVGKADEFDVQFTLHSRDQATSAAVQKVKDKVEGVVSRLRSLDIDVEEALVPKALQTSAQYTYLNNGTRVFMYNAASEDFLLTLRKHEINMIEDVLRAILGDSAQDQEDGTQISGTTARLVNSGALQRRAAELAVTDVLRQAATLCSLMACTVAGPHSIEGFDDSPRISEPFPLMAMARTAKEGVFMDSRGGSVSKVSDINVEKIYRVSAKFDISYAI